MICSTISHRYQMARAEEQRPTFVLSPVYIISYNLSTSLEKKLQQRKDLS